MGHASFRLKCYSVRRFQRTRPRGESIRMGTTLLADDRNWDHLIHTWTPGIDQLSLGGGILAGFYLADCLLCFRYVLFLLPRIPGGGGGLMRSCLICLRRDEREE